jgi:gamma-glutamyltranspeptidase/glutathione hydrolase
MTIDPIESLLRLALLTQSPPRQGHKPRCFCLVAKPGAPLWGYNGSGRSAAAARPDVLIAQGISAIGFESVHSVTVPGAVDARDAVLAAHGRFGLDRALAPAIHHAEHGFPVAPRVACDCGGLVERLRADPGAARHHLVDGRAPLLGDIMRFPALAAATRPAGPAHSMRTWPKTSSTRWRPALMADAG